MNINLTTLIPGPKHGQMDTMLARSLSGWRTCFTAVFLSGLQAYSAGGRAEWRVVA